MKVHPLLIVYDGGLLEANYSAIGAASQNLERLNQGDEFAGRNSINSLLGPNDEYLQPAYYTEAVRGRGALFQHMDGLSDHSIRYDNLPHSINQKHPSVRRQVEPTIEETY